MPERIISDLKETENIKKIFMNLNDTLSIGRIFLDPQCSILLGTAFVAGKTKSIFTCSHVAIRDTMWFSYLGSSYFFRIKLKYNLPNYDVALLERTGGNQPSSLNFGDFNRTHPGDIIEYIGWDVLVNKYVIWKSIVIAKGVSLTENGVTVEFIEFAGEAIPGYSGGPVFNSDGQVIAIIREAWEKKGIKGGASTKINRAFSVDLLRILDSEILSHSSNNNVKIGLSILELLSK